MSSQCVGCHTVGRKVRALTFATSGSVLRAQHALSTYEPKFVGHLFQWESLLPSPVALLLLRLGIHRQVVIQPRAALKLQACVGANV